MSGGKESGTKGAGSTPGPVQIDGIDFTAPRKHNAFSKHPELMTILGRWENPGLAGIQRLPRIASTLRVWRVFGALLYISEIAVDADGAPDAYGPAGTSPQQGFDPAGVVAGNDGQPVKQTAGAYVGYYLSATSLRNPRAVPGGDPSKFVDANKIPYIALPAQMTYSDKGSYGATNLANDRAEVGDYVLVVNLRDSRSAFAIVADLKYKPVGEGSVRLCELLGLRADAVHGNDSGANDIAYLVFPGSSDDVFPESDMNVLKTDKANDAIANRSVQNINEQGAACFSNWLHEITKESATTYDPHASHSRSDLLLPNNTVSAVSNLRDYLNKNFP